MYIYYRKFYTYTYIHAIYIQTYNIDIVCMHHTYIHTYVYMFVCMYDVYVYTNIYSPQQFRVICVFDCLRAASVHVN